MQTVDLGAGGYSSKEAAVVEWLHHNAPRGPAAVQLRLVCLRGGQVDAQATARLHRTVYEALGPNLQRLDLQIHRPELCSAAG